MKEYKVGEQITLEVREAYSDIETCKSCIFNEDGECIKPLEFGECGERWRSDGKNIIFVEKGK